MSELVPHTPLLALYNPETHRCLEKYGSSAGRAYAVEWHNPIVPKVAEATGQVPDAIWLSIWGQTLTKPAWACGYLLAERLPMNRVLTTMYALQHLLCGCIAGLQLAYIAQLSHSGTCAVTTTKVAHDYTR